MYCTYNPWNKREAGANSQARDRKLASIAKEDRSKRSVLLFWCARKCKKKKEGLMKIIPHNTIIVLYQFYIYSIPVVP